MFDYTYKILTLILTILLMPLSLPASAIELDEVVKISRQDMIR